MQQEDDLRALAKIMDFGRAVSIFIMVIHVYVYCYPSMAAWQLTLDVINRILLNFDRTTGIFGCILWTKLLAVLLLLLLRRKTVKFETFGGTAIDSRKVRRGEKLTPPMLPVKEGAAFGGWFADQACTKLWSFDSDTVEKSMTLYAKWQ